MSSIVFLNLTTNILYSMYLFLYVLFCLNICLHIRCMSYPWRWDEGIEFPGSRVMDGCKPSCQCWKFNLFLLQGQPVLLTDKLSLQGPSPVIHNIMSTTLSLPWPSSSHYTLSWKNLIDLSNLFSGFFFLFHLLFLFSVSPFGLNTWLFLFCLLIYLLTHINFFTVYDTMA